MARSPFKPGKLGRELHSTGRYKAPPDCEQPAPPTLVQRLMEDYFCGESSRDVVRGISLADFCSGYVESPFRDGVAEVRALLEPYHSPSLDPDAVLGALIGRLASEPVAVQVYAGRPLTLLVQSFYDLGHNGFLLDLTPLSARVLDVGNLLCGDESREKLRLDLRAVANYSGVNVRRVSIEAKGDFHYLGHDGVNSEFALCGSAYGFAERLTGCSLEIDGAVDMFGGLCTETRCRVRTGSTIRYYHFSDSAGNTIFYE